MYFSDTVEYAVKKTNFQNYTIPDKYKILPPTNLFSNNPIKYYKTHRKMGLKPDETLERFVENGFYGCSGILRRQWLVKIVQ